MKRIIKITIFILLIALSGISVTACRKDPLGCSVSRQSSETGQITSPENTQVETSAIEPAPVNQEPTKATVVVQIHSASTNRNPFHVSVDGLVGAAAPRLTPGEGVNQQKEITAIDGKFPVKITISRNGAAITILSQNVSTTSCSVLIFENAPNDFKAQWI